MTTLLNYLKQAPMWINVKKTLIIMLSIYSVSGCSSIADGIGKNIKEQLSGYLEHQAKRDSELQNVLNLESDMQLIIAELAQNSHLGTDPLGQMKNNYLRLQDSNGDSLADYKSKKTRCANAVIVTLGHCYN